MITNMRFIRQITCVGFGILVVDDVWWERALATVALYTALLLTELISKEEM